MISIKDFQKLDLRIGTVIKAEVPSWSHWVTKLTVDFGQEVGKKTIFAGIMHFYKPKDLEKKQLPFLINIEPKKIGPEGDFSEGMLLAATCKSKTSIEKPTLLIVESKVPNGTKIR